MTENKVGQKLLLRYGAAAVACLPPVLLTYSIPALHRIPFALCFLVISLLAWLVGLGPALLATVLCVVATNFYILEPNRYYSLQTDAVAQSLVLAALAVFIAWLTNQNKIARLARQRSEASHSVTLASIGDAVIATDKEGLITYMNAVASDLTGWPEADAKGRSIHTVFRIINEESRLPVENPVDKVRQSGSIVRLSSHTVLISRSGREINIDDSGAPILDSEGKLNGVVLVFRNIENKRAQDRERDSLLQRTLAAERTSQETLALYQFLTEALPIYVWMGEAGKFEFCNRHVLEFTGLTFEQIQAGGTFELVHPDDRQRFIDESRASLRTGQPLTIEYRIRRADGVYRWHFARSSQFIDPNGRTKWLGTAIDLTERKIAEEELRTSEDRLRLAQTAGGIGMWDWDLVTNQVQWSPEYYAHFGLRPGEREASFESFLDSIHPKDRESVKKAVEASINSSGRFSREFRVLWPDGSLHWLFYQGQVLRNELEEPVRMIGICSDITTRKLAEQELRSANERLSLALSTAQMGDWEWDIRENKIRWSEEVLRMHGVTQFDGRFETWFHSVHPDDHARAQAAVDRTLRTGEDYELEYRTLRPDGGEYWTLARGVLKYDSQGVPVRLIGVCMDINTRKKSEEAIRRSEKLAAAGRLAASISHEINNPLESVTNLLYLMNSSSELPPDVRRYLGLAQSELARISQIAIQTLRFYRQSTRPGWADIPALIDSVISLYQARLASANITVVQEVSNAPQVFCYEGELRQVFVNLVGNAIDAMAGRGGQLSLRVRSVRSMADRDEIRITIADNGTGISPDSRKHLFEPFFTTKGNTGTGLGLWLSLSVVHKHNGVIRVRTRCEPPSGTVFVISLPLRAAELEQSTQDRAYSEQSGS